jgi:hypothetical protein
MLDGIPAAADAQTGEPLVLSFDHAASMFDGSTDVQRCPALSNDVRDGPHRRAGSVTVCPVGGPPPRRLLTWGVSCALGTHVSTSAGDALRRRVRRSRDVRRELQIIRDAPPSPTALRVDRSDLSQVT